MKLEDYPSYYRASDKASQSSQCRYIWLFITEILVLIFGSGLTIYNFSQEESKLIFYIISGLLFLIGIVITVVQKLMKFDSLWYQGRALAESCKTITWRYVTCSEEFNNLIDDITAKEFFLNKIEKLSKEFEFLNKHLDKDLLIEPIITSKMEKIRIQSLSDRKKYYLKERINEQKKWYSKNAKENQKKSNSWYWINILSYILSIGCIVFLILNPNSNWNFIGLFTTISTSIISWTQLKQFQNLNQAYTTASIELNLIAELYDDNSTEEEFSKFVLDSENAISREHTTWLAQSRNTI